MVKRESGLLAELRAVLAAHGGKKGVREAVAAALADGVVTAAEMAAIRMAVTAALAMEGRHGEALAAALSANPGDAALAEAKELLKVFEGCPEALGELRDALSDGRLSREELDSLRMEADRIRAERAVPQGFSGGAFPFPTMAPRPEGVVRKGRDGEEE